jgi:asparagine synthase (glutamine-hydrolysing)
MILLAQRIAEETDVKVVLSGEGADELFHGYSYFAKAPTPHSAQSEAARLVSNLHMFDLLRAERCFSHVGMEVRVPFLDAALVDYVQSIDPSMMVAVEEKKLLRSAFANVAPLVETRILERPKERFSDGCGFSYVPRLLSMICNEGSLDTRLVAEKEYVGLRFDEAYPGHRHLIIERSMPEWASSKSSGNLLGM